MKATPTEEREERPSPHRVPVVPAPSGPPQRRRKARWGWVVVVLGLIGVGYTYWYNHKPQEGVGGRGGGFHRFRFGGGMGMAMPVVAEPAKTTNLPIYLNGLGTVTPVATVTVRTQIAGQLKAIDFKEGQEVKQNDLLAVIDDRPYRVAEMQAQGQLLQAQAQLQQARSDLARYQMLAKEDSIAQQQVDQEKALVSQYQGLCDTAQAAIDNAKLNQTYCHITAPVDGRVGLRLVDVGNYVTPGDTSGIVVLTQVKPITVVFSLPEDDVDAVADRLRSGATLPVYAYDRGMTKRIATGQLLTIDNEIDTSTGTVRLRASFPNADEALFPNEFVNARMLLDTKQNALVVPASAIERGEQGPFVYVVQADNTVLARPVTLGPTEGENQSILTGIAAGDRVVSDGADKLKDGMAVTVQQPGQSLAPAAHAGRGAGKWKGKARQGQGAD